jgi:hypothetical protein
LIAKSHTTEFKRRKSKKSRHVLIKHAGRKQGISWLFEFEVQDQADDNHKDSNNGTNNPLVLVDPP